MYISSHLLPMFLEDGDLWPCMHGVFHCNVHYVSHIPICMLSIVSPDWTIMVPRSFALMHCWELLTFSHVRRLLISTKQQLQLRLAPTMLAF